MMKEFREFLLRGNVVDLAVAFVIGAAFVGVVSSFTINILSPLLGLFGFPDLSSWDVLLPSGAVIRFGVFLMSVFSFVLVAAAIFFFVIRPMNALEARRQRGMVETPTTKTCVECATDIPIAAMRCPNCTQLQP